MNIKRQSSTTRHKLTKAFAPAITAGTTTKKSKVHILCSQSTNNYDHPIIDGGVLLTDMVVLRKSI